MNVEKFVKVTSNLSSIWRERLSKEDVKLLAGYAGVDLICYDDVYDSFSHIIDKILSQNSFRQQIFIEGAEWFLRL